MSFVVQSQITRMEILTGTSRLVNATKSYLYFGRFAGYSVVFKFLSPFFNRYLITFIKNKLLWFFTWTKSLIVCFKLKFPNQQKTKFCPNVRYNLIAFTWSVVHLCFNYLNPLPRGSGSWIKRTEIVIFFPQKPNATSWNKGSTSLVCTHFLMENLNMQTWIQTFLIISLSVCDSSSVNDTLVEIEG